MIPDLREDIALALHKYHETEGRSGITLTSEQLSVLREWYIKHHGRSFSKTCDD